MDFLNVSIDRFLSIQSPTRLKIKNHQTRGWIVIITALYRHHKGFHSGLISEGYHRSGWERRIMVKINTAGHWETDYDLGGALTDSSKLWMSDEIATLYKTSQDQKCWPCRIMKAGLKRTDLKNCWNSNTEIIVTFQSFISHQAWISSYFHQNCYFLSSSVIFLSFICPIPRLILLFWHFWSHHPSIIILNVCIYVFYVSGCLNKHSKDNV